jgi:hypothetical protein
MARTRPKNGRKQMVETSAGVDATREEEGGELDV